MKAHANKTQDNKNKTAANNISRQQAGSESAFQFVNNSPETIAKKELQNTINTNSRVQQLQSIQDMANTSPGAQQALQLQAMMNNSPRVQRTVQLQTTVQQDTGQTMQQMGMEEEKPLQGKAEEIQRQATREQGIQLRESPKL